MKMEVIHMPFPKPVRIAAIVSQAIIVLWVVLTIISSLFQDKLIELFIDSRAIENTEKIGSWSVCVSCIAAIIASVANALICSRKTVYTPLVMTAVTSGLLPVAVNYIAIMQAKTVIYLEGANAVARWSSVQRIESTLSYFLSAALVITIAASAVYVYAQKNFSESGEKYDIADN